MPLSKLDAYVAGLYYDINDTSKNNAISRVRVSANLLETVRQSLLDKTDNSFKISNKNLINYALLNLLNDNIIDSLKYQLDQHQVQPELSKLLSIKHDPRQEDSVKLEKRLMDIQQKQDDLAELNHSQLVALSWLLQNRMGLDRSGLAQSPEDAYAKLRSDDLKHLIDEVLRAGINEQDRQRHLTMG